MVYFQNEIKANVLCGCWYRRKISILGGHSSKEYLSSAEMLDLSNEICESGGKCCFSAVVDNKTNIFVQGGRVKC